MDRLRGAPPHVLRHTEYNRACAHAQMGDEANAEMHLRNAMELGWADPDHLEGDRDFEGVRATDWFQSILAELRA